jgi:hypothetical protein
VIEQQLPHSSGLDPVEDANMVPSFIGPSQPATRVAPTIMHPTLAPRNDHVQTF